MRGAGQRVRRARSGGAGNDPGGRGDKDSERVGSGPGARRVVAVLWDVQHQGGDATGHTSFSENDREAHYHADNGELRVPERFFLLYVVREAGCGGGCR